MPMRTDIGYAYQFGEGVKVDNEKAIHYYEQAAMRGDETARYNLGVNEARAGNFDRALKHYVIAARDGLSDSLTGVQLMYTKGHATKEDYTKVLLAYQAYLDEIKSDQRDKAAAFKHKYRYY